SWDRQYQRPARAEQPDSGRPAVPLAVVPGHQLHDHAPGGAAAVAVHRPAIADPATELAAAHNRVAAEQLPGHFDWRPRRAQSVDLRGLPDRRERVAGRDHAGEYAGKPAPRAAGHTGPALVPAAGRVS